MKTVQIDDAAVLDIVCKVGRDFDIELDLNTPLTADFYVLTVEQDDNSTLIQFDQQNFLGLTVASPKIRLHKTNQQMNLATGCYRYSLTERRNNSIVNILIGSFIVKPANAE